MNNPAKFIDPDGQVVVDGAGNIVATVDNTRGTNGNGIETLQDTRTLNGINVVVERTVQFLHIYADDGTAISVQRTLGATARYLEGNNAGRDFPSGSYDASSNCHGLSLANGKFWINPNQAALLLEHDYQNKDEKDATTVVFYNNSDRKKNKENRTAEPQHSAHRNNDGSYNHKDGFGGKTEKDNLGNAKGQYSSSTTNHFMTKKQADKVMCTKFGTEKNGVRIITDPAQIKKIMEDVKKTQ